MIKRTLPLDARYRLPGQRTLAYAMAGMDEQLDGLLRTIASWEPRHFEWQVRPGHNTAGMLLAHIAIAELYWGSVASRRFDSMEAIDDHVLERLGLRLDDDGMPAAADALPPRTLAGRTYSDYETMLRGARGHTHAVLLPWTDEDLDRTFLWREREFTQRWVVYHIAEHFSGHYGQVLLLRHLMVDAGVM